MSAHQESLKQPTTFNFPEIWKSEPPTEETSLKISLWEKAQASLPVFNFGRDTSFITEAAQWLKYSSEFQQALLDAAQLLFSQPRFQALFQYHSYLMSHPSAFQIHPASRWPFYEDEPDASLLYPLIFLAHFPKYVASCKQRNIPDSVMCDTLQDLDDRFHIYRSRNEGVRTFHRSAPWFSQHFLGNIFRLGRLQFTISKFPYDASIFLALSGDHLVIQWNEKNKTITLEKGDLGSEISTETSAFDPTPLIQKGDFSLAIHIPEIGPLDPQACLDSLQQAREFYARHFPENDWKGFYSTSWLYDPQLAHYLPESNIVRFQRLFYLFEAPFTNHAQIFERVFGHSKTPDLTMTPKGSLQKAVLDHLRNGGEWKNRGAFLPF
ncbi:MAG: acyltransferase domain-containing protein [Verrucomicrobiota bacterium]